MRIAVFSFDPIFGEALASLLVHTGGFDVVAVTSNILSAQALVETQRPDLLIFNEDFGDEKNRHVIRELRHQTRVKTLFLCSSDAGDTPKGLEFDLIQSKWPGVGALCEAIRSIDPTQRAVSEPGAVPFVSESDVLFHGELTARERATADLVAEGNNNKQIAVALGISEPTAKLYVSKLLRLLKCANRVQLALKLRELKRDTIHIRL